VRQMRVVFISTHVSDAVNAKVLLQYLASPEAALHLERSRVRTSQLRAELPQDVCASLR